MPGRSFWADLMEKGNRCCGGGGGREHLDMEVKMAKVWMDGRACEIEPGTVLSRALQQTAPEFALPCGGGGRCGKCKVKAEGALSVMEPGERELLTQQEIQDGIRLACRAKVEGDCRVRLPGKGEAVILQETQVVLPEDGKHRKPLFERLGAAVDIGTTTMAACLYEEKGLAAQAGMENPQLRFGADVISRIEKSLDGEGEGLAAAVRSGIGELISRMAQEAGRDAAQVDTVVITGNTAMLYLLTKRSPDCLSHAPFQADWLGDTWLAGRELDLPCGSARVYLPPCIGSFVGADTATAILSTGLCSEDKTRLLVDIGTNGEVALWKDGGLCCCSTAAGPAFEGTGLSMGMAGRTGAVAHVRLSETEGKLEAEIIGQAAPEGICGSGVVDAVACLLQSGRLDETGYLEEEEAVIADPVRLTQQDIRMVQLAKSAICAGMKTMLHQAGLTEEDVDELLVAGGFGSYLELGNAVAVGLLPRISTERITVCRNAALAGAVCILLDEDGVRQVRDIAQKAQVMELATDAFFQETYIEEMFFAK